MQNLQPRPKHIVAFSVRYGIEIDEIIALLLKKKGVRLRRPPAELNPKNFPRTLQLRSETGTIAAEMVRFDEALDTPQAMEKLHGMRLWPVGIHELLELAGSFPEVLMWSSLVALGSKWTDPETGLSYIPYIFYSEENGISIDLMESGEEWSAECSFPAVTLEASKKINLINR